MKLYQAIAQNHELLAGKRVPALPDQAIPMARARQKRIEAALPRGSGFDSGTTIVVVDDKRIVLHTSFHHMDENGCYCGWKDYTVTVRASLVWGLTVKASGYGNPTNADDRDYIEQVMHDVLTEDFEWYRADDAGNA